MKKHKLITIVGNIGSGKTTAMPIIANALSATMLHADDLFQSKNPFREFYLNNIARWALTTELWMTIERMKLLHEHLDKNPNRTTVIDSGLLMSWVYAHSHYLEGTINLYEWKMYENLYNHLTKDIFRNSHVIFFSYSVKTLKKRIKKRGRDYELRYYNNHYLYKIEKGLRALKKILQSLKAKVYIISEKNIKNFENNKKDRDKLIKKVKALSIANQF